MNLICHKVWIYWHVSQNKKRTFRESYPWLDKALSKGRHFEKLENWQIPYIATGRNPDLSQLV